MNTNNSGLQQVSSFITNNMKNANNVITNVHNSALNHINKSLSRMPLPEPVQNSMNATMNQTPVPLITIPVIISIGVLIVLFILFVIFRSQIISWLEIVWKKVKGFFGWDKHEIPSPPPFVPDNEFKEVEKILPSKKQVFNVSQNKYTYTDAEPLCKAFGAELATYDQVKDAWSKGADWCNYGWVKGQAAVYPTQESTYNKLQQGPEDERMACGTPGVNGGYFDNPELRFGVNCYGDKPSESDNDIRNMMSSSGDLTPGALAFDRKVTDYKAHMSEIPVNPFSYSNWSS
jgi:hypothetical protein